jgi:hypothetical protein
MVARHPLRIDGKRKMPNARSVLSNPTSPY